VCEATYRWPCWQRWAYDCKACVVGLGGRQVSGFHEQLASAIEVSIRSIVIRSEPIAGDFQCDLRSPQWHGRCRPLDRRACPNRFGRTIWVRIWPPNTLRFDRGLRSQFALLPRIPLGEYGAQGCPRRRRFGMVATDHLLKILRLRVLMLRPGENRSSKPPRRLDRSTSRHLHNLTANRAPLDIEGFTEYWEAGRYRSCGHRKAAELPKMSAVRSPYSPPLFHNSTADCKWLPLNQDSPSVARAPFASAPRHDCCRRRSCRRMADCLFEQWDRPLAQPGRR